MEKSKVRQHGTYRSAIPSASARCDEPDINLIELLAAISSVVRASKGVE
jgi:hypothetical protein